MPSERKLWFYGLAAIAGWLLSIISQIWHGWWWIGLDGRALPLGYICIWSAGRMTLEGAAATIYDPHTLAAFETAATSDVALPWLYPPIALPVVAPLASLPFLWSCFAWLTLTGLGYLAAIRAILPYRLAVVMALAAPAAYFNINQTETGFATAGLVGATLAFLPARPVLAGVALGCLTFKPQFGLLFPFVLVAAGQWRAVMAAAATALSLAGAVVIWPGWQVWQAFLATILQIAATTTGDRAAVQATSVDWQDMQSWYSVARYLGLGAGPAWGCYAVITGALALALIRLWRGPAAYSWKAAALAIGSFLATPYVLVYDACFSVVAVAFVIQAGLGHGFRRGDVAVCAAALAAPMLPLILHGSVPLLPIAYTGFLIWILHRAGDRAPRTG